MLLSKGSKYALRAAIHLAQHMGEPQLSRDIAQALGIPAQYLAKVLQDLARHGILRSMKGRGGGFQLALPPERLDLMTIVRAMEGEHFGEGCALGLPQCSAEDPCPLHDQWEHIRAGFMGMLERTRLVDLPSADSPGQRELTG